MDLSIILTCYNESEIIKEAVDRVSETLSTTPWRWQIIIVDGGSIDDSREIIRDIASHNERVIYRFQAENLGRGAAVTAGIRASEAKIVGFIDTDLEVSPTYISAFVQEIMRGNDLVIGRRVYGMSMRPRKIWSHLASRTYKGIIRQQLNLPIYDPAAGFKFFNRQAILPLLDQTKSWQSNHHPQSQISSLALV